MTFKYSNRASVINKIAIFESWLLYIFIYVVRAYGILQQNFTSDKKILMFLEYSYKIAHKHIPFKYKTKIWYNCILCFERGTHIHL